MIQKEGKMEKFKLLNDVEMPVVGFGTWQIEDGEVVINAVSDAIELGYTHIDTAAIYKNELGVGKGIKKGLEKTGLKREDLFITTKVWNDDQGYESTLKAFETSLKKLDLDYVDLYLIHWPLTKEFGEEQWKEKVSETWRAMEEIYLSGKTKAIGVCNFLVEHLEELFENCKIKPMVNQIELHPGHNQEETVKFSQKHNIIVQAWSPLGSGRVLENKLLNEISEKYNKSTAQICLKWLLQQNIVVLPKSINKNRIESNIQLFDFEIKKEDMEKITNMEPTGFSGCCPSTSKF